MKSLLFLLVVSAGPLALASKAATAPQRFAEEMKPSDQVPSASGSQTAAKRDSAGPLNGKSRTYAVFHHDNSPGRSAASNPRPLPEPPKAVRPASPPKFPQHPPYLFM